MSVHAEQDFHEAMDQADGFAMGVAVSKVW
jgi:hypothetical protein